MKIQNTLISILVINFNNAKLLTRAINSCLDQSYKNFEILIFDDGSSDNSREILKKFKNNKKIKIFFNKKKEEKICCIKCDEWIHKYFQKNKGEHHMFA